MVRFDNVDVKVVISQEWCDFSGNHRILLRDIQYPPNNDGGFGSHFHSITWECMEDAWNVRASIMEPEFRMGSGHRMWICELHSFSPITGLAIIRVGEEHPIPIAPQKNTDVVYASRVVYTWRQWDLIDNVQMNVIRTCDPNNDPLEDY
jgi:hypothetical protein